MNSNVLQHVIMARDNAKWRFAVDRGGTFTDLVSVDPEGRFHTLKLLSSSPHYEDASVEGIRRVLGLRNDEALPEDTVDTVRLGTTVATNALLERSGGKTALFITKGFSDLLEIGHQTRPDIFSVSVKKPSMLYSMVFEVDERIEQSGQVIKKVNSEKLMADIEKLKKSQVDSVAVILMHSWKNPAHELFAEKLLKNNGFANVFLSHKTLNLIKIISRGHSTVVDAYLSTTIARYLDSIKRATGSVPLEFIKSSGGISAPEAFHGKDALLSGPAGGVIAVAKISKDMGLKGAIGFDMGGTSTDVSRYDGELERRYEQVVDGIELQNETLNIVTVASGGGSALWFDGQKMRVGPESAGANPGPACYGFGGPLTITDANLFTGRIIPAYFPKTFGPDRKSLLITNTVKEKFAVLTETINATTKQRLSPWEIANGFIRIANENMAQAIKEISVSKGFDVRDYTLVCFGGAGGQHACQVASLLGIKRIIFHSFSGVMSAYGIGLSTPSEKRAITVLKTYNRQTHGELSSLFEEIERNRFSLEETDKESMHIKREIDLRPQGADTFLTVEYKSYKETFDTFRDKHKRLYGFWPEKTPLEVVNVRVEVQEQKSLFSHVSLKNDGCDSGTLSLPQGYGGQLSYQNIYYQGEEIKAPVYHREFMIPFEIIKGPAFIIDRYATVVVEPHFEAYVDKVGTVTVTQVSEERQPADLMTCKPDPVLLEVFYNLFMGVATEMGYTLKNTAHSVNIKERLDFSCAIFDHDGNLVANAPHIPVHIGAMADTVKAIIKEQQGNIQPGDVFLTNDPYRGGSHLPDLTVVHPVFSDQGEVLFFTAARGHHADIGGITPGSMPPATTHIDEEGVLIRDFLLVRDEKFREEALLELFQAQRFPVRNVAERIGDLKAQVASCHKGENELKEIISRYGWNRVCNYMGYIQDNGAFSVKNALSRFLKGKASLKATFADYLDDDTPIKVSIYITGGSHPPDSIRALIDFSGTGDQHNGDNLNAPLSVARSAVLYVLRLLIKSDIPLNSGCLRPIEIKIPEGTILNPAYPAPVASGNVETSQRIVDALLGALALAAASQGTMNNLLFEVEGSPPYYETIAGGSGATDNCPGASGVQVHMTNTRGTDPEILESRFPGVRLEQLTLRRHSGGEGRYRGGDGIVKEIRFLKPAKITIISERRIHAPYGMAGGRPGKRGINYLKGTQGKKSKLPHRVEIDVKADDVIRIETPGGGGYGEKPE